MLRRAQGGDALAEQQLCDRYYQRLRRLARTKLHKRTCSLNDEEDVVVEVLTAFLDGMRRGQYPGLVRRGDLWRLLAVITTRKTIDLVLHETRKKRRRPDRSGTAALPSPPEGLDLTAVPDPRPSPDLEALFEDQCRHLLACLHDAQLERIAVWKLEGYADEEIAAGLDCSIRTVERKVRLIRTIWWREMRR